MSIFNSLYMFPTNPRNTLKCPQTIHICFDFFNIFLCFEWTGNLDSCLLDKDHTDGTPGTHFTVQDGDVRQRGGADRAGD